MFKRFALAGIITFTTPLVASGQKDNGLVSRTEVPGEIVVCFKSGGDPVDLNGAVRQWNLGRVNANLAINGVEPMMRWQRPGERDFTNVVLMRTGAGDNSAVIARLNATPGVLWASPNYAYTGDFKDLTPNDSQYGSQYHHPKMQNNLAWDTTMGSPNVIVAITDDGYDIAHPDISPNVWINTGEIAGNSIDDDGNGFVDDVNGWDFYTNNNNPTPNQTGDAHGTHVIGIAGARTNNAVGVAGTAGGCRMMTVQFYMGGQSWTSTMVANAFTYATNNGAKIISTSYNIDGFVGDATAIVGFQYLYDQGVLHLNSAGNNNQLNPARQAFHQTLLVASTDSADVRSSFSNYGTGVDVAAPGSSILSTLPNNTYGNNSGTSMATPNAAGVAALIWSAHPMWTRDQVAAQLVATCDNIDVANPGYVNLLGGGRVNSFKAVTQASLPAPKILGTINLPANNGSIRNILSGFAVRFNQVMAPASVNTPSAFTLTYAGADGLFNGINDTVVPITRSTYMIGANQATFLPYSSAVACGRYRLTANGAILENPFGTKLDGDGNGTGGDSWSLTFKIEPCVGDIDCNDQVNTDDLLALIGGWGTATGRPDVNGDGLVNTDDLLLVIGAWGPCIPPPPPPPANDNCANATAVGTGTFAFDNSLATLDGPTPVTCSPSSISLSRDMWYFFTPTSSGTATVNTCAAATFDTVLVAYSGECGALTQVTCNDDNNACGSGSLKSQITFPVTSGTPVRIRLARYGSSGAGGTGTLTISIAP